MWEEIGMSSVNGALSQIYHRDVFRPANSHKLTWKQKREALEPHMFLVEKRNHDIKCRIMAETSRESIHTRKKLLPLHPILKLCLLQRL